MKRRAFGLESTAGAIRTLAVDFSPFVHSKRGEWKMKAAKSSRQCRIIKNGIVIFEGPDEKCLSVLMRLKYPGKYNHALRNSSLRNTVSSIYKPIFQQ